jgi:hypothetical protein
LKVLKNKVRRKIYEPKREELAGGWRKLHNEGFYAVCIPHGILLEVSKQGEWNGRDMWHVMRKGKDIKAYDGKD